MTRKRKTPNKKKESADIHRLYKRYLEILESHGVDGRHLDAAQRRALVQLCSEERLQAVEIISESR